MTTENIALFQALGAKMDFLNQRQRVIAQNIANTDTPGYRPKDMKPVDFSSVLKNVANAGGQNIHLGATKAGHMSAQSDVRVGDSDKQKRTYEVAPSGNAVIMEEQLLNSGQTMADYTLMTSLLRKNMGLINTALGRQQ